VPMVFGGFTAYVRFVQRDIGSVRATVVGVG
jgi:hypothetical protein